MAFPEFGGPVSKPVEVAETAASRFHRDIEQQGGEVTYTVAEGAGLSTATEHKIAATAPGGRTDRELTHQTDERKDRLYADGKTGVSAVTGDKYVDFDELKAGVPDANLGAAQTALVNYNGMTADEPLDDADDDDDAPAEAADA